MYRYDPTVNGWRRRDKTARLNSAPLSGGALANRPCQPSAMVWDTTGGAQLANYGHPGALITVGANQIDYQGVKAAAAAGATILMYINPVMDIRVGGINDPWLHGDSGYGPAVGSFPGHPEMDTNAYISDFTPTSDLHRRFELVLRYNALRYPHIAGFMVDDVGTRTYYETYDFDSWSAADKQLYRDGAIKLVQTARRVADAHDMLIIVNGTWLATSSGGGGGYPSAAQSGCSLADGGVIENQSPVQFWFDYADGPQWATQTPRQTPFIWSWNINNTTLRDQWAASGHVSHALAQVDRGTAEAPWGSFHEAGLPRRFL